MVGAELSMVSDRSLPQIQGSGVLLVGCVCVHVCVLLCVLARNRREADFGTTKGSLSHVLELLNNAQDPCTVASSLT